MIYKNMLIMFFVSVIITVLASCAKKNKISGIYVHLNGPQHYYTMTITQNQQGKYLATLEGVPLDQMKSAPWSLSCEDDLSGNTLKCDSFSVAFNMNDESAEVTYTDGDKQVFVSDKKKMNEELKVYEKSN
ncbi:MAG TPA: hypothetical protein PK926_01395 [Spirochaetota bacterium]|nr:hypothetical protein [Spirochaetota bacterium]HPI88088.1 hypothetical protein [Spirochaetota bacterium]HPR46427.1 hypothetical protein [Spirochaetota bacterium]